MFQFSLTDDRTIPINALTCSAYDESKGRTGNNVIKHI